MEFIIRPFSDKELEAIKQFILDNDKSPKLSYKKNNVEPQMVVAESPPPIAQQHACRYCESNNVKVAYGNSYYFKCSACDKNTKIDFTCRCGAKAKISKRGNRFNWKCDCGNDSLFFENPE